MQKESEKAKQECTRLMADRNDLKSAGGVIERAISALTVQLTKLKSLPLPWGVTTSNMIEELARKINEKTLQLNVFRSEIEELNAQINVLQTKIISLENKKRVVEMQISDLQIHINNDEQSLEEARLNLSNKIFRIGIVEQNIKQTNTQAQTYSNEIDILRSRILALSASQQGSGGVIPEGLEELQRALQNQRALLSDALNRLEALHFEHGC